MTARTQWFCNWWNPCHHYDDDEHQRTITIFFFPGALMIGRLEVGNQPLAAGGAASGCPNQGETRHNLFSQGLRFTFAIY